MTAGSHKVRGSGVAFAVLYTCDAGKFADNVVRPGPADRTHCVAPKGAAPPCPGAIVEKPDGGIGVHNVYNLCESAVTEACKPHNLAHKRAAARERATSFGTRRATALVQAARLPPVAFQGERA